jgi:hypothetical protein
MKLGQLMLNIGFIRNVLGKANSQKSVRIARWCNAVESKVKAYEDERNALIRKVGVPGEKEGEFVIPPGTPEFHEFSKVLGEMLDGDVADLPKLSFSRVSEARDLLRDAEHCKVLLVLGLIAEDFNDADE